MRLLRNPVVQYLTIALLLFAALSVGTSILSNRAAERESVTSARSTTWLLSEWVEPALPKGLVDLRPSAIDRLDRQVRDRLLVGDVRRIKIWRSDGTILYSDETRLIGDRYELGAEEIDVLDDGGLDAEVSDLTEPENRYEQGTGGLLEVYTQVQSPEGEPLLFELYFAADDVESRRQEVLAPFQRITIGGLLAMLLIGTPIIAALTQRLTRAGRERERLLRSSMDASAAERRRIARDLHDGVVQDLAGTAFSLSAVSRDVRLDPGLQADVGRAGTSLRGSLKSLRSLLVSIHPPDLRADGLNAALTDLTAPAVAADIATTVSVEDVGVVPDDTVALVWRVAQEAVRNAIRHAGARSLDVSVRRTGDVLTLSVADDGVGFDTHHDPDPASFGLRGLTSLVADARAGCGQLAARSGHDRADGHRSVNAVTEVTITIVVVDDHAVVRGGLTQLLDGVSDLEVVGTASDGAEAIEVVRRTHPDVVLMDLQMPGVDGVSATRTIVAEGLADVLVLTSYADAERIVGALDAGAVGYLLKDADADDILGGIRAVARGESPIHPRAARELLDTRRPSADIPDLTPRELEVLGLVREGLANKQIARRLGITERTVKAHLTSIFATIGVADRTSAALWAERHRM